jgi:hypothetical protein
MSAAMGAVSIIANNTDKRILTEMSEILEHKSKPYAKFIRCDCCDGIGTGIYNRNGTSIHNHEQNRQENLTEMSKILECKSKPKAKLYTVLSLQR